MKQILPGIRLIQVVDCALLPPNVGLKSEAEIPVSVLADLADIPFVGFPSCEHEVEPDNNATSEKTTLEFTTTEQFPFSHGNYAFVVTCVSGESYLIGTREAPFPVIGVRKRFGSLSGDAAGYQVQITFVGLKTLIQLGV